MVSFFRSKVRISALILFITFLMWAKTIPACNDSFLYIHKIEGVAKWRMSLKSLWISRGTKMDPPHGPLPIKNLTLRLAAFAHEPLGPPLGATTSPKAPPDHTLSDLASILEGFG